MPQMLITLVRAAVTPLARLARTAGVAGVAGVTVVTVVALGLLLNATPVRASAFEWQAMVANQLALMSGDNGTGASNNIDYEFAPMRGRELPRRCTTPHVVPVSGWSAGGHIRLRLECGSGNEAVHLIARRFVVGAGEAPFMLASAGGGVPTEAVPAARATTVAKARVFSAGSPVRLLIQQPGFSLMGEGRAQGVGVVGESVVVVMPNGRRVSGLVRDAGVVEIPLKFSAGLP